ncbi:endonuclease/exonuclease/phosphatase family protein, partial [Kineococcus sp. R8]|uniref:endonuclease/exonuclease/phosphatase family protein n=1 Tax=Kineococcus siccus TaxID=2696567 RepID=UPI0014137169
PLTAALATRLVVGGVVACGAVLLTAPQWVDLAGQRPFVWSVSFRVPAALGTAALAGVAGLVGRRRRAVRPAAVVLAVAAGASLVLTLARGVGPGALPPPAPGDVTVVAANVFVAAADPAAVAEIAVRDGADAVSLPEATQPFADDVAARILATGGPRMQVFFAVDGGDGQGRYGTALLVSEALGEYRTTGELADGYKAVVTAAPVSGRGPVLAAAHTAAPVTARLADWRRETAAVAAWCAATPGALLAGDLNATLDHPGLHLPGSCVDAGQQTGTGARGTWPARVPALLGTTIDHALADGDAWRAVGSRVEDLRGSDHRALVTRWRPVR